MRKSAKASFVPFLRADRCEKEAKRVEVSEKYLKMALVQATHPSHAVFLRIAFI